MESKIQNPKSKISFADVGVISPPQTAALPKDLVQDDEVVILMLRPSPMYVILASQGSLLGIALVAFALAYLARLLPPIGWSERQAFMLGLGLAALRLGWQFLEWITRLYILTDRRIICRGGVLRLYIFETQLRNIQHTSVFASMRERVFGLGTIGFATAGSDTFHAFWTMIRQPFAVHKIVVDAIRRYGR